MWTNDRDSASRVVAADRSSQRANASNGAMSVCKPELEKSSRPSSLGTISTHDWGTLNNIHDGTGQGRST